MKKPLPKNGSRFSRKNLRRIGQLFTLHIRGRREWINVATRTVKREVSPCSPGVITPEKLYIVHRSP